jgi:hypothetical protein
MEDILDHPTAGNKNYRTKQKKKKTLIKDLHLMLLIPTVAVLHFLHLHQNRSPHFHI